MKDSEVRKLIDSGKPYQEMTEEEIEAVVDWKINAGVNLKMTEKEHEELMTASITQERDFESLAKTIYEDMKVKHENVISDFKKSLEERRKRAEERMNLL